MAMTNTAIRRAKVGGRLTPGKYGMKVLKTILDAHVKLKGTNLRDMPPEAAEEAMYRAEELRTVLNAIMETGLQPGERMCLVCGSRQMPPYPKSRMACGHSRWRLGPRRAIDTSDPE